MLRPPARFNIYNLVFLLCPPSLYICVHLDRNRSSVIFVCGDPFPSRALVQFK